MGTLTSRLLVLAFGVVVDVVVLVLPSRELAATSGDRAHLLDAGEGRGVPDLIREPRKGLNQRTVDAFGSGRRAVAPPSTDTSKPDASDRCLSSPAPG